MRPVVPHVPGAEAGEDAMAPFNGIRCGREHGQNTVSLAHCRLVVLIRHALLRPYAMTHGGERTFARPVEALRAPDSLAGVLRMKYLDRVLGGARLAPRR